MQYRIIKLIQLCVGPVNSSVVPLGLGVLSFSEGAEGEQVSAPSSLHVLGCNLFSVFNVSLPPSDPSVIKG